jgi:peptidoglycan hydrolase CwlO-like protein
MKENLEFMKKLTVLLSTLMLSACTLPSFYDDNESWAANNVQYAVNKINCHSTDKTNDISHLVDSVAWLTLYSQAKGSKDVVQMVDLMNSSVKSFRGDISTAACNIKKEVLREQAKDITTAIMRRY